MGLPVPLATGGVFTGNEQEAQRECERFPGNIHNLTWDLIQTLEALERHVCVWSCVLVPLSSLLVKNNSKKLRERVSSRYRLVQLICCFAPVLIMF